MKSYTPWTTVALLTATCSAQAPLPTALRVDGEYMWFESQVRPARPVLGYLHRDGTIHQAQRGSSTTAEVCDTPTATITAFSWFYKTSNDSLGIVNLANNAMLVGPNVPRLELVDGNTHDAIWASDLTLQATREFNCNLPARHASALNKLYVSDTWDGYRWRTSDHLISSAAKFPFPYDVLQSPKIPLKTLLQRAGPITVRLASPVGNNQTVPVYFPDTPAFIFPSGTPSIHPGSPIHSVRHIEWKTTVSDMDAITIKAQSNRLIVSHISSPASATIRVRSGLKVTVDGMPVPDGGRSLPLTDPMRFTIGLVPAEGKNVIHLTYEYNLL